MGLSWGQILSSIRLDILIAMEKLWAVDPEATVQLDDKNSVVINSHGNVYSFPLGIDQHPLSREEQNKCLR